MKTQVIEITGQYPSRSSLTRLMPEAVPALRIDVSYWMHVYPPLSGEFQPAARNGRPLCPWSMAAETSDPATPKERRHDLLNALKTGQKIIRQFGLPANRIRFIEERPAKKITIWVD